MTPEEFTRLRSIFDAAAELDAEQRERFLADEASRNPEIVVRVRRLLGAPAEPLARVEQTIASAFIATPGSRVDRYTLLAPLGDGGMGEVWLAEQQEPIRRRVALKMIKAGMDTKQVIARFDAERQALAMLSHPAVAQVLDAGATEAGRPYFVMEYVEGAQIDRYCDRKQLDVRKRLRLFQRVCAGVQHAHDRTIIHRDLKPSNVLVTEVRGEALPKIIDFGIAKALARDASPSIDVTQLGEVVGTPDYMSPEQLARGRAAVDTRSDVYSLGVILYELLTGSRPFARSSGRDRESTTMAGSVRADPPRPSESLRRSRTGGDNARSRQAQPGELIEQLRGDLDWIVLKAVAADPQRRYRSPLDLADDLERYLEGRPVLARPPTLGYLASRFVRRHRVAVAAAATVLIAVMTGAVGTALGWQRALQAEAIARHEAATATEALEFVVGLFKDADPMSGGTANVTALDLVNRGAARLEAAPLTDPLVTTRLAHALGDIYTELAHFEPGRKWLERAYSQEIELLGREHPETLRTAERLAYLHWAGGPVERAERYQREVFETRLRLRGADDPGTIDAAQQLVTILLRVGQIDEAERLAGELVERTARLYPAPHERRSTAAASLAAALAVRGRTEEAERLLRQVIEERTTLLGADHIVTASAQMQLVHLLLRRDAFDEAESLLVHLDERVASVFGPGHKAAFRIQNAWGDLRARQGRFQEAALMHGRAYEGFANMLAADHPDVASAAYDLADSLVKAARPQEAERVLLDLIERRSNTSSPATAAQDPAIERLKRLRVDDAQTGGAGDAPSRMTTDESVARDAERAGIVVSSDAG